MLNIQNPRWIKYQNLKEIFWSKDSKLKEKVTNWIISIFWKEYSYIFLECLEKILNWEELENTNNTANATLEYIFDYWNISKELEFKENFDLSEGLEDFFKKNFNSQKSLKEIFFWELPDDFFIKQIDGDEKIGIITIDKLKNFQNILENRIIKEEKSWFNFFGLFWNKNKKYEKILEWVKENVNFCIKNELDMIIFSY